MVCKFSSFMQANTHDGWLLLSRPSRNISKSSLFRHGCTSDHVEKGKRPWHVTNRCVFPLSGCSSGHLSCFPPSSHPVAFKHTACTFNVDTTCLTKHKIRTICFCSSQQEHAFSADKCNIKDTASTLKSKSAKILQAWGVFAPHSSLLPAPLLPAHPPHPQHPHSLIKNLWISESFETDFIAFYWLFFFDQKNWNGWIKIKPDEQLNENENESIWL